MVIVCDAVRRMENAVETLRPSFRGIIVQPLKRYPPKTPHVTRETDASNTVCRLPGAQIVGVKDLSSCIDFVATVSGLIQAMGLVPAAVAER